MASPVQCAFSLPLALALVLLWAAPPGASSFTPATVDGKLVVPDTGRIDNAQLKEAQADKFLSLWFIYVLIEPVHTSDEPWTLFVPKNSGLPKGRGFLEDPIATRDALINHAVLGTVLDPADPPRAPLTTLAGTPVIFTSDASGAYVNGVRLTGEEIKLANGVVYVIDSSLPILALPVAPTRPSRPRPSRPSRPARPARPTSPSTTATASVTTSLPPLTHRFATFKPRRPRPIDINSVANTKPELPFESDLLPFEPELLPFEPELAEESIGTDDLDNAFTDIESAGLFPSTTASRGPAAPTPSFSEFAPAPALDKNTPFLKSFLDSLVLHRSSDGAEFLHHFIEAELNATFRDTGRYTALVPSDSAFYKYYPIDWGFNPFLVANFTRDVILNHFLRGNVALEDLPRLAEMTTLGGSTVKFTRRGNKLLANGVEVVLESETSMPRGRSYKIQELLFVDYERVKELLVEHGDLESAPLLGSPWPTSQFLSHLLERVEKDQRTSFFAEYLNTTNLAYLLPGIDENLDTLKYTAFVPVDGAILSMLYADAPDPFMLDDLLREQLLVSHLVEGRLYEDDLQDGLQFLSIANDTITITRGPDGAIQVNDVPVIESQVYIYNLGIVYLIDGVLGVTDQDILRSINKFPDLPLEGPTDETSSSTVLPPLENIPATDLPFAPNHRTTFKPSTTTTTTTTTTPATTTTSAPSTTSVLSTTSAPTTTSVSTTKKPATTSRLTFPHRPPKSRRTSRPNTRRATTTATTTTATTPQPSPTTPRIRFETRTEISVSRKIDDGSVEPINVETEPTL